MRLAIALDAGLLKKAEGLVETYIARNGAALLEIAKAVYAVRAKKGGTPLAQWVAFRLEAMSGFKLPHGYAVSIGLCVDLEYAVAKGFLKPACRERAIALLKTCGALDALNHSRHLLCQTESLLFGLDAWALSSGSAKITVPCGVGKSADDPEPDREVLAKIMKDLSVVGAAD